MGYFAELQAGRVVRVVVADSVAWCVEHLGGTWEETADPYSPISQDVNYCGLGWGYGGNLPERFAPVWNESIATVAGVHPITGEAMWAFNGGEIVWHNGRLWRNVTVGVPNVWEPGVSGWHDAPETGVPLWIQPTGAHDAYNIGDRVLFEGSVYESVINANVWSPTAYPAGWTLVP